MTLSQVEIEAYENFAKWTCLLARIAFIFIASNAIFRKNAMQADPCNNSGETEVEGSRINFCTSLVWQPGPGK